MFLFTIGITYSSVVLFVESDKNASDIIASNWIKSSWIVGNVSTTFWCTGIWLLCFKYW